MTLFLLNKQNLIFSRLVVTPVGPQSLEKKSPLFERESMHFLLFAIFQIQ